MLTWFEVENFKSIKKLHVDLKDFMVLVGANGAGKTNVVQALALLLDILTTGSTEPIDFYGGYEQLIHRERQPAREMRFLLRWPCGARRYIPRFSIQVAVTLRFDAARGVTIAAEEVRIDSLSRHGAPFIARWAKDRLERFELGTSSSLKKELQFASMATKAQTMARIGQIEPTMLRFGPLYSWFSSQTTMTPMRRLRLDASALRSDVQLHETLDRRPILNFTGRGLPLALERLRPHGKPPSEAFKRVLLRLREVYPNIEDVRALRFQPGRVVLSFKERTISGELGESNVSDGVMHALALLVAVEDQRKDVLAIEEPENALHPWALRRIVERIQDSIGGDRQLVITTHSPVVVDAVKDPASLFIVENDERRGTTVTPALQKERALNVILAETGQKLGEVWLGGSLGGVPRTGT